jgi:hypothetical protein
MKYITPDLIISLVSSSVILLLIYLVNKRNKEEVKYSVYFKQYLILVLSIYIVLYIKKYIPDRVMSGGGMSEMNLGQSSYQSNIRVGEPNF